MAVHHQTLTFRTQGAGLHEITEEISAVLRQSSVKNGIATVFCRHTSCSLVIMENADPSARQDLERWLNRLVPERDPDFTHTAEGPDDMPSHIKMALTRTSETIPVSDGQLQLGAWQGIYLWEHRRAAHSRQVIVTILGG